MQKVAASTPQPDATKKVSPRHQHASGFVLKSTGNSLGYSLSENF
jgi:hypothetical protein